MATLENGDTLVQQDESLFPDDFEVIERHVDPSENHGAKPPAPAQNVLPAPNPSSSLWSIQQSITIDGNLSINSFVPRMGDTTLQLETPVLDGSVIETTETLRSEREEGEGTLASWGSNDTLNSMLASHAETKQLLESSIAKFETMRKELGQLEELKSTVEQLKRELAEKTVTLIPQEAAQEGRLQEDLYQKDLQIDQRDSTLTTMRGELEVAHRTIADLQNTAKYLNDQLDQMCAQFLQEKEHRAVAEEQLNAQMQGRPALYDRRAAGRELSLQTEQLEKKDRKIKKLDEELRNRDEIIRVLREDHLEGNRLIAEKEHKITELETIMKSMDERLMMDSS